ncbi:hypothetical protein VULLAG_LOCUS20474 [Vulpes lagopus]
MLASTPGPRGALVINVLLSAGPGERHGWFCRSRTCQMQKDRCQNPPTPGHTLGRAYVAPDQETGEAKEQERRRGRERKVNRGGKESESIIKIASLFHVPISTEKTQSSKKSTAMREETQASVPGHSLSNPSLYCFPETHLSSAIWQIWILVFGFPKQYSVNKVTGLS